MNDIKNSIGWADESWNPVVGCKRVCSYCYAKRLNDRYKWLPDFSALKFYPERLNDRARKDTKKVFVGSMTDICYWEPEWMKEVIDYTTAFPEIIFMFLTKNGKCYRKYDFPLNCWLGITYTDNWDYFECKNKMFLSIEPLIKPIEYGHGLKKMDLVIIGGLTPRPVHQAIWVDSIIKYCQKFQIPYFLKKNLHYTEVK